jgi:hypothetical protein
MRISREKINHLSNVLVKDMEESDEISFLSDSTDVRINVVRAITNELVIDDEIDEEVRRILSTYSSRLIEGTREWEVLYNKHYDQEAKRRGV